MGYYKPGDIPDMHGNVKKMVVVKAPTIPYI
jgi:hypothetical protein